MLVDSITLIHPGEHLSEILDELNISQQQLACGIEVLPQRISAIINGRRITADMALRLGRALETTPEFWLNLQLHCDLERARAAADYRHIKPLVSKAHREQTKMEKTDYDGTEPAGTA